MFRNAATLLLTAIVGVGLVGKANAEPIKIGWTAWSDAEFVTKLAKEVIETRMDQDVKLIQTDIAPQYQGVSTGDIDVMLMSWQPSTHQDYLKKVRGKDTVFDLGLLYGYARLGWAVPDYIPKDKLSSISDLKNADVRDKLDGTITGIDPGAGLTRLSKKALKDYGLDGYRLQTSSGAGMTAALDRAIKRKEWIVVTAWSPHWMFGKWDLRYLDDPKGTLGSYERVHAVAHIGFYQTHPKVALMLSRMQLPLDVLQSYMFKARQTSYEDAVKAFVKDHPKTVDYWVNGKLLD
ncbi:MAG TPA: glycine betaine ABC transporter substrate-binding protein [Gammaproteobacteria bacterium]|nr:glycine betaine ABC transporter substrate-binding protein [Gammaproteobacteria bacterium]